MCVNVEGPRKTVVACCVLASMGAPTEEYKKGVYACKYDYLHVEET